MDSSSEFVVIRVVQGEFVAAVLKSHLESEGIPVVLEYESVGRVFGLTVDGLGQVKIKVPKHLAEKAAEITEPVETEPDAPHEEGSDG